LAGIQSIRGMNDILPEQSPLWQYVQEQIKSVLDAYGYSEIRMPVLESTNLFKRSIGEVTDIVEKEMYTFDDRNGDSLTLRPEGTAGCVRAAQQAGLLHNQLQRLWYFGPMFRYERPQKGRYRQFHQFGVETFGMSGAEIDAEVIILSARIWKKLGMTDAVTLELNSLGSSEARAEFKAALVEYLTPVKDQLDEDSQRRLESNPLRILDSKSATTQAIVADAPKFSDYIDQESLEHFEKLKSILDQAGVSYVLNPLLVRGLDYYGKTVFEWTTDKLGAQGTVCAGGRYDGLVKQLGGKATPAVGFGLGVERLLLLLETLELIPAHIYNTVDAYLVAAGEEASIKALAIAEQIREQMPNLRLQVNCAGGSFKSQMKKADKCGAKYALILGDDEIAAQSIAIKDMTGETDQQTVLLTDISAHLTI
jgi:histidyl-tRNA synthetase